MAERTRGGKAIHLDLVGAVRRAYLRRGVFIPPATNGDTADGPKTDTRKKTRTAGADDDNIPTGPTGSQEPQEVHEKLIDITEKAQDVLFEADTVFPFTLFPDTITLDREKLTVATRTFFRVAKIVSVPVSSVSSAEVDVGPFFGSLHMASKYFVQNKYSVNFLPRSAAIKLQRLLQGFIISQEKKIDLTDIEKSDLLMLLGDLGQGVSE